MTRAKISEYSATANDNTDVNGVDIAEGCPPSSMNNMGREIMAALKRFQVGSDGDGVTVGGALVVSGATTLTTVSATVVQSDTVSEKTSAAGVTVDGVLLKDSGVVTGAGTVSAPVYSTTGDTNTGIFFPAADTIAFAEGGAEAMRIDSSGRVGIGTSSPSVELALYAATTPRLHIQNSTSGTGSTDGFQLALVSSDAYVWNWENGTTIFGTNNTERMRITSGGNLLVGTSAFDYRFVALTATNERTAYIRNSYGSGYTDSVVIIEASTAAGTGHKLVELYSNGVMQFYVRGDGTIYAQNTTVQSISDIRTKENIRTSEEGLDVISALRPVRFDFKEGFGNGKKNQLGFVAQEVEPVFPDAVSELEQDGETYKSVGPGALIPVLVKAIQELSAKNDALEARIAILEAQA